MKFQNAANGVKKIFGAEILGLIGTICMIVTALLGVIAYAAVKTESGEGLLFSGIGAAVFGIGGVVLLFIGYIIKIVGVNKASNDEPSFKTALFFIIFALICSVGMSFFSGNEVIKTLLDSFNQVANLAVTVFIIAGIRNLALRVNRNDIDAKGSNLYKIIVVIYALIIISKIITAIFNNTTSSMIALIFVVIAGILQIVQYFLYIAFLCKGKNMLAEN